MTYHFEYTLDYPESAEPQEWEVFLTPEEEDDYREEGMDPADAAEQIAAEEILDLEAATLQAVSGEDVDAETLRKHLSLELTEIEADDDPDEDEDDDPDENEDDP